MTCSWLSAWVPCVAACALATAACGKAERAGSAPGSAAGARSSTGAGGGRGVSGASCNARVLILGDEVPDGATSLAVALTAAGLDVTASSATSSEYAGVPALMGGASSFGAVVVLGGGLRTPPTDMPAEGQKALVEFVRAGHGLVLTEWAAFHLAAKPTPRWQLLEPLVLLERSESYGGRVTYEVEPAFASHPLWAGLPASFTFTSTSNVGTVKRAPGVARIASSPQATDAVAIRDLPAPAGGGGAGAGAGGGRIVHLAHAGNHVTYGWVNVNVQRLMANAVSWVARCERDATAGTP